MKEYVEGSSEVSGRIWRCSRLIVGVRSANRKSGSARSPHAGCTSTVAEIEQYSAQQVLRNSAVSNRYLYRPNITSSKFEQQSGLS
jgi:hypothetical protein